MDGISDDAQIFEAVGVNSLFAVQLVMWVERTFGVPVASDELNLENFQSISALSRFVERKLRPLDHANSTAVTGGEDDPPTAPAAA